VTKIKYLIHFNNGEIIGVDDTNCLEHFGILGMKWGRRRTPEQIAAREAKLNDKVNKKFEKRSKSEIDPETKLSTRGSAGTALFGPIGAYVSGRRTNVARGIDVKRLNPQNKKLMKDVLHKQIKFNETPAKEMGGLLNKYKSVTIGSALNPNTNVIGAFINIGFNRLGRKGATKRMRKTLKKMEI